MVVNAVVQNEARALRREITGLSCAVSSLFSLLVSFGIVHGGVVLGEYAWVSCGDGGGEKSVSESLNSEFELDGIPEMASLTESREVRFLIGFLDGASSLYMEKNSGSRALSAEISFWNVPRKAWWFE